jgi:hypothetical protein
MRMHPIRCVAALVLASPLTFAGVNPRDYVSSTGDDSNTCTNKEPVLQSITLPSLHLLKDKTRP